MADKKDAEARCRLAEHIVQILDEIAAKKGTDRSSVVRDYIYRGLQQDLLPYSVIIDSKLCEQLLQLKRVA